MMAATRRRGTATPSAGCGLNNRAPWAICVKTDPAACLRTLGACDMALGARYNVLRVRRPHEHARVTFVELFFDLVFVFAVTQLSHRLLEHFTPAGVAETALLLCAVWWLWIYTCWATNWLDPQTMPVRVMLFVLMLAGLVLSTSIPQAFGSRAFALAAAYVFMQVGRTLFILWALRRHSPANFRNFQRIVTWLITSSVFWIAGAFAEGETRFALWALALAIEYGGPAMGFWTPGLGRSATSDWDIEGAHIAERCGLFIIIALGESILVTGATFAKMDWTLVTIGAFTAAFVGSVAMWWVYFNIGAERASESIANSSDPGRTARLAYTYIHLLIVAGIVVTAVGDELVLAHPAGHSDAKTAIAAIGGPALFLLGNILFKKTATGRPTLSHWIGLTLLALLATATPVLSPLALGAATTAVLVVVAIWETRSFRDSSARTIGH
jgi:low temperature requirement protein LtrA